MKDLNKITIEELKQFEDAYVEDNHMDIDDFLDWLWGRDLSNFKYHIKKIDGDSILEVF